MREKLIGMVLLGLALNLNLAGVQADIIRKVPRAQNRELKRVKDGPLAVEITVNWIEEGHHSSMSIEERDAVAADNLFRYAQRVVTENNSDPDKPMVRFAGVNYIRTDNGWSHSKVNPITQERSYECGGRAVGYILTYP